MLKQGKSDKSDSAFILHPSSFILVPLLFLLIKLLLIDPQLTPLRQTQLQNGALNNVAHSTQIDFGDQLRLLGYRLSPDQSPSGETVRVDVYWRALHAARQELSDHRGRSSMRTAKCGVPRRSIGRVIIKIIRRRTPGRPTLT